jgi:small subunit ribosomal protein S6
VKSYDLVYIVKPDLDGEALAGLVDRVNQRLREQHAVVEHTEVWGKRRMAYPIQRYREGQYVFVRFSSSGDAIPEIKRALRISEDILRASVTVAVGSIARTAPPAPPAGHAGTAQPEATPAVARAETSGA